MKPIKRLLCLIIGMAILFASPIWVNAVDFEAEDIYESVFVIYSGNSMGSGFAIGENCIVTNAHVIDNRDHVVITTYSGEEYRAYILGMNVREDIAVLLVESGTFPALPVADLAAMKTGDDIYAIGAPKGMAYTLTKGGVSAKEREIGNNSYIQIDAPINEGNSGGPLLNGSGEVLGMNTLKMSDSEGIGLAIPITSVCDYVRSLGIDLDARGNAPAYIEIPGELPPIVTEDGEEYDEKTNENEEPDKNEESQHTGRIARVLATLSLIGNVVLGILLVNQKKKTITVPIDPRERTDFEIDIWE